MSTDTSVLVLVQDHELNSLTDATVTLTDESGVERALQFDENLRRYVADGIEPGTYALHVSEDGLMDDDRTVNVHPGENNVRSTLGSESMSFYRTASGERAFFHPDENKALVYAHGRGARQFASDLVADRDLSADELRTKKEDTEAGGTKLESFDGVPSVPKSDQPSDEVTLLVDLPNGESIDVPELQSAAKQQFVESSARSAQESPAVRVALPMYRGEDDDAVEGLTDELVVSFEPDVDTDRVADIAAKFDCEVRNRATYTDNGYVFRYEPGPDYALVDIAEELSSLPEVVYAEPNVAVQLELHSVGANDYLYPEQTYLDIVDASGGWDVLEGEDEPYRYGDPNVTIAVADSGTDPGHPDLRGKLSDGSEKLVESYDFVRGTKQDPAFIRSDHGTKSSATASARSNSTVGVSGVAGNCRLIGMRVLELATIDDIANTLLWAAGLPVESRSVDFPPPPAHGADVISNSWGPSNPLPGLGTFDDALETLTRDGRNGRGCVVCFSAGNYGYRQFSKLHQLASDPRTIAVGASIGTNATNPCSSIQPDPDGFKHNLPAIVDTRTYFNPYGAEMDLVAPSHTSYDADTGNLVDPVVSATITGTGDWPGDAIRSTTLTTSAHSGDTELFVEDSTGFSPGKHLVVGTPGKPNREFLKIEDVLGSWIAVSGVANDHPNGTSVATGPNDYARSFGGTSHACPTVAGAVALVLSANPKLTWDEVREILHDSAVQIDPEQSNDRGKWFDRNGKPFSLWYGYGRLNVRNAVSMATPGRTEAEVVAESRVNEFERRFVDIARRIEDGERAIAELERQMAELQRPRVEPRPSSGVTETRSTGLRTNGDQSSGNRTGNVPRVSQPARHPQEPSSFPVDESGTTLESARLLADLENALRDVNDTIVRLRNRQSELLRQR